MTATSIRAMKEVRLLVWPTTAVTAAAFLAIALDYYKIEAGPLSGEVVRAMALFAGLPLLAGLALGSEFQFRTLGLTLAQPVERSQTWRMKMLASVVAVSIPALLFCVTAPVEFRMLPFLYVIVFFAAAFPATLIARSIIGGAALDALFGCPAIWGSVWLIETLRGHQHLTSAWMVLVASVLVAYAAALVWLGYRMFLRFEAAEGMQSVESILPGANFIPDALADIFRCRPRGLVLNLIRREFRLLRFIWPLAFVSVAGWMALIAFHIIPLDDAHPRYLIFLALVVINSILIALLCGALSLGEEKSWGTHDWQLTLPVSPSLQWFVKLAVGLSLSVLCGAYLPKAVVMIAYLWTGNPSLLMPKAFAILLPADMICITLLAFWASCILKGTAKASMFAFPAFGIALAGIPLGSYVAENFANSYPQIFNGLISWLGPIKAFAIAARIGYSLFRIEWWMVAAAIFFFGILLLQSHRLFPHIGELSSRQTINCLAPIFLTGFAISFFFILGLNFMYACFRNADQAFRELHVTVERARQLHPQNAPFVLSSEQLTAGAALSPDMQRFLSGASVLIVPQEPERRLSSSSWLYGISAAPLWSDKYLPYSAVVRTPRGETCDMVFRKIVSTGRYEISCD